MEPGSETISHSHKTPFLGHLVGLPFLCTGTAAFAANLFPLQDKTIKTANRNYTVIARVIEFLKEKNEIQKLSEFLNHSSDGVKGWAATYLLPIKEREAIQALEEIAKGIGIRSLAAETTLSEWRKGNLKL